VTTRASLLEEVVLAGQARRRAPLEPVVVVPAETATDLADYHRLRRAVFVEEQGLFTGSDLDEHDDDPRTRVLLARTPDGELLGGVRLHPMTEPDLGWWRGSRLAVARDARMLLGVGAALVRAACASAEDAGALRFDATVQAANEPLFRRLGWVPRERIHLHGTSHVVVDWPISRIQRLVDATKAALGPLVGELVGQEPHGFRGDDGAPVPGSNIIAACDAILPSMVERDPEWAGWCAVLVNLNDLSAMGAAPVGLLDAVGARDASFARRVLRGVHAAARAWDVPVLGGHTQLGVPGSLAVTALGRTDAPVPGGGGRPGQTLRVTADLGGGVAAWLHRRPVGLLLPPHSRGAPGTQRGGSRSGPNRRQGRLDERAGRHDRDARRGLRLPRGPRRRRHPQPRRRRPSRLAHLLPRLRHDHRRT